MRGQIIADFIVEHRINDEHDLEVGYITCTPWKLYLDGLFCDNGKGYSVVLISPSGAIFVFSNRLKRIAQIIKLSMKPFYLALNFCNLWASNMWKPLMIYF